MNLNDITDDDEMVIKRVNAAVKIALYRNAAMDIPSIIYDRKTKMIYELRSNGDRILVAERSSKGRYSEWIAKKI